VGKRARVSGSLERQMFILEERDKPGYKERNR